MARIRSVKPSLRTSRVVAQWPQPVRYFWVLLWGYLDDAGRGLDRPRAIAADCYPLEDDMTSAKVDKWLGLMASTRRDPDREPPLCRYTVGGERYLHAVHWLDDNQRINRPTPSAIPPCPIHESEDLAAPSRPAAHESFSESLTEPLTESPLSDSPPYKEKEKEGEGERVVAEPLTQPHCRRHPAGTDRPCRDCQRARQAADAQETALDQAKRDAKAAIAKALAAARSGPPCRHGTPGGAAKHPTSGQPLCPQCRSAGAKTRRG